MSARTKSSLRHNPTQVRGQRKVEHILAVAEEVFADMGFERATTNCIAQRADISIGSLYQFFTSKEAILEAIAERYLERSNSVIREVLERTQDDDMDTLVTEILAALVQVQEKRPYFLQCLSLGRPHEVVNDAVVRFRKATLDDVVVVLKRRGIPGDGRRLRLKARICAETISALLPLVLYARGQERTRVASEIKQLLLGYLVPLGEGHKS